MSSRTPPASGCSPRTGTFANIQFSRRAFCTRVWVGCTFPTATGLKKKMMTRSNTCTSATNYAFCLHSIDTNLKPNHHRARERDVWIVNEKWKQRTFGIDFHVSNGKLDRAHIVQAWDSSSFFFSIFVSWSDASAARVEHSILGPASCPLFERKMFSSSSFGVCLFKKFFLKKNAHFFSFY